MSTPHLPGIYRIRCTDTQDCYVGSAGSLRRRRYVHLRDIRLGTHVNAALRKAVARYGSGSFVFEVLELCPEPALLERERHWIKALKPKYNDRKATSRTSRPCMMASVPIVMDREMAERIEQYRAREFYDSRATALRQLIRAGLKASGIEATTPAARPAKKKGASK